MKNTTIFFIAVAVVLTLGFGAYAMFKNPSQSSSTFSDVTMKMEPTKALMEGKMSGSRYVQYSKSTLDAASGIRRVLFFYASWCPTCKPADVSFMQNESKIPEDLTIVRVNYNDPETDQEEKDLAKKYGVTYQHTFVQIDNLGNEITKWNGGQIEDLLSKIK